MIYLISKGADINAKTSTGKTPLHNAVKLNRLDVVRLLIRSGAEINVHVKGWGTVLDITKDTRIKSLLVKAGGKNGKK